MASNIDNIDRSILRVLQHDASLSQRDLAEKVGLSQNACWRRLKALRDSGLLKGETVRLDSEQLGLGLTVFVLVRTRHHSADWLKQFREVVLAVPNVMGFYRVAGDYDYIIKIVAEDMNAFDRIYQRLIGQVELDAVTSYLAMESIADGRDLPV
ncbi:MAG: Lrp/AsnC family transcriptional regulator [Alphaproteobacteria bacterium]|uniref:Lrp/AsnC family transcriptional regulator n=1 Tax=Pararhizobium sp. IMCC21322 TaxID=3067903 RepID=UPI0027411DB5|nr:Lrp/AsnC family transcriptional regulator [Pararhizobium sp. IMCC21322]MCR9238963.1 Lrp/AsnC family transcriptional regulator [Alphaproteobacteria bacterium]